MDSRGVFDSDGDMFMLGTQVSMPRTEHILARFIKLNNVLRSRMAGTDTMPSNASLPSSGATEPLLLPVTHTLLPPSGMCKRQTDFLAYQTDKN